MDERDNVNKLQSLYGDFGRGNVPAVLDALDPDVVWTNPGPLEFPCFGVHRGRDAVARNLFAFLARHIQVLAFEPIEFVASADKVMVLIRQEAVAHATGRRYAQCAGHLWTFRSGVPVACHDFQDTYAVVSALQGSACETSHSGSGQSPP